MSAVAVGTSVLLAIFKGESKGELWLKSLQSAAEAASLLVSSVVFVEVMILFSCASASCASPFFLERLPYSLAVSRHGVAWIIADRMILSNSATITWFIILRRWMQPRREISRRTTRDSAGKQGN